MHVRFPVLLQAATSAALLFSGAPVHAAPAPRDIRKQAWRITIPEKGEPGTKLVLSGQVFLPDGTTPAPGVTLYVFHTDAGGTYSKDGMDELHPRLHGTLLTGPEGRYEVTTIRPGGYPSGDVPAHIHLTLRAEGYPEKAVTLYFAGDSNLPEATVAKARRDGRFGNVRPLVAARDGSLTCTFDLKLTEP